jgi:hypothetical protein
VSPTTGTAGTQITITGTNLGGTVYGSVVVLIDGVLQTIPVTTTDAQLVMTLSTGGVSGPLTVAMTGCPTLTPVANFVVPQPPGSTAYTSANFTLSVVQSGPKCGPLDPSGTGNPISMELIVGAGGIASGNLFLPTGGTGLAGTIAANGVFTINGDDGNITRNLTGTLGPDGAISGAMLTDTVDASGGAYSGQCPLEVSTYSFNATPYQVAWNSNLSLTYSASCPGGPGITNYIVSMNKTVPTVAAESCYASNPCLFFGYTCVSGYCQIPADDIHLAFSMPNAPGTPADLGTSLDGVVTLNPGGATGGVNLMPSNTSPPDAGLPAGPPEANISLDVSFMSDGTATGVWTQGFPGCAEAASATLTPLSSVVLAIP